jgi:hypothetical protein
VVFTQAVNALRSTEWTVNTEETKKLLRVSVLTVASVSFVHYTAVKSAIVG